MVEDSALAANTGLSGVMHALRCPLCKQALTLDGQTMRCIAGHCYDLAKQGYVSLLAGPLKFAGDSAEMVAARQNFLDAGHYERFAQTVADAALRHLHGDDETIIAELGAGTGHYLARVLEAIPRSRGIAVDASKPAARRAARAHPRAASVLSDAWSTLPIADHSLSLVMSVFAPRNAAESARILGPGGVVLVLSPGPTHLLELVEPLGLIHVDERKSDRLEAAMGQHFEAVETVPMEFTMMLSHREIEHLVAMGPSARHGAGHAREEAIGALAEPLAVTASASVTIFRSLRP